ncbi:MAG: extracellular catalytic domain type 1 short-chain-length polyhydroxyalkanoate depolymerase [Bdellovibrionota bacterium]
MKTLLFVLASFSFTLLQASAAGNWQRQTFSGMSYWLYTPSSAGNSNALMINLHGCGQHADDLKTLGNWESAAEKYQMVVAIPDVPNGGVVLGCWNYYGRNHTATNNDNGVLLGLTQNLMQNSSLHIDKNRVYASGLSAGATEAVILGCLRPDLFSGVASNSGPALGSDMNEISNPHTTAAQVAQYCKQLAGNRSSYLATQKAVIIRGDQDFLVNIQHATANANGLAQVYGASAQRGFDLKGLKGSNLEGSGTNFSDASGTARVSLIINNGLQHNWAAGNQKGGQPKNYVNPNSVDLPEYLGEFFSPVNAQ